MPFPVQGQRGTNPAHGVLELLGILDCLAAKALILQLKTSRSIAASSNDFFESLLDSLTGEHLCFAGTRCSADGAAAGDRFDTFLPVIRLFITCSWVENDDCVLHTTR